MSYLLDSRKSAEGDMATNEQELEETRMTPAEFVKACRLIWGTSWHGGAAAGLDVGAKTVTRWQDGSFRIPAGIEKELAKEARKQIERLRKLAERLEA
jgi:hypothetical protein